MWRRVAPQLAERFTVRGFGASGTPPSNRDHAPYSMREIARDQIEVMNALGYEQFAVAGHDRGARCAYRLRLLARLLADPGREFHAVDLEAADRPAPWPALSAARAGAGGLPVRPDLGDAGELLDAQAKAAYKARLGELAAELEEAQRCGDPSRAAAASAERDFLVGELARAVGLGGRDRRARGEGAVLPVRAVHDRYDSIAGAEYAHAVS